MTLRDQIVISMGNLWRMKLRTILTSAGILIAIAAFISMLSFGAGNQAHIEKEFNKLGLFTTMQVYPKTKVNDADTTFYPKLDKSAIERISTIHGVNIVYPYDALTVTIRRGDSVMSSKAQALPLSAMQTKLFSGSLKGNTFTSDSAKQAIISSSVMKNLGINSPDSAIGQSIILSVKVSTIDSGLAHIVVDKGTSILEHVEKIEFDSLFRSNYRSKVLREGINEVISRFVNGFMSAQATTADTLVICGIRETAQNGPSRVGPVLIPVSTASRFRTSGFSGSPMELISSAASGSFSLLGEKYDDKTFSQVTVDFDPKVPYKAVKDSIEALGYRTFSFAAEFEEIQQVFFYFDLGLGVIGLLALITASLGIVNTMVMSILERRKEIGILKSLGADDRDIRFLFLVESGVIGLLGTWAGIFTGWVITRIISAIAQHYMEKEGIPRIELFALPIWLILMATAVGLCVSVAAGLYPASRAAKIDPVEALRND